MRLRATLVASALALLAALAPASASASWKGAAPGSASAKARSLGSVAQPTTSIANRNVTVRWTAPGSGAPVTGYLVRRYDQSGNVQTIGAGCSGSIATTSCTESAVPPGRWRYRVTAVNAKWAPRERGERTCLGSGLTDPHDQRLGPARLLGRRLRGQRLGSDRVRIRRSHPGHVHSADLLQHEPLPGDRCQRAPADERLADFGDLQHAIRGGRRLAHGLLLLRRSAGVDQRRTRHPRTAADPVGCVTGTTQTTFSTALLEVSSTPIANDLRARVYVRRSGGAAPVVDQVALSVLTSQGTFALFDEELTDRLGGSATTRTWPLVASGGTTYVSASTWPTAFSSNRYLLLTFPAYVPGGATVSGGSFLHRFRRSGGGGSACWYVQVFQGTTVIGTCGSAASPISCTSGGSYRTDTVSLPEINSPARANGVVLRVYVRSSTGRGTEHDQANLTINYAN